MKPSTNQAQSVVAHEFARRARDELDEVFVAVARYFGLLSEPTRLKILHTICHDERSVTTIVAATGATQTNVSRHLALMHHAGVVSRRRDGNIVYYRVTDPEFVEICRTVCVQIAGRIDAQRAAEARPAGVRRAAIDDDHRRPMRLRMGSDRWRGEGGGQGGMPCQGPATVPGRALRRPSII